MPIKVTFFGLTCFQKLKGKRGYNAWLPDGRRAVAWGIPTHVPHIRIRPHGSVVETNWAWPRAVDDNYVVDAPCDVFVTGLADTGIDEAAIAEYVQPLKQADRD